MITPLHPDHAWLFRRHYRLRTGRPLPRAASRIISCMELQRLQRGYIRAIIADSTPAVDLRPILSCYLGYLRLHLPLGGTPRALLAAPSLAAARSHTHPSGARPLSGNTPDAIRGIALDRALLLDVHAWRSGSLDRFLAALHGSILPGPGTVLIIHGDPSRPGPFTRLLARAAHTLLPMLHLPAAPVLRPVTPAIPIPAAAPRAAVHLPRPSHIPSNHPLPPPKVPLAAAAAAPQPPAPSGNPSSKAHLDIMEKPSRSASAAEGIIVILFPRSLFLCRGRFHSLYEMYRHDETIILITVFGG